MKSTFDIDIDIPLSFDRDKYGIRASIVNEEKKKLIHHNSGVYPNQSIPVDIETGLSAIPYKEAEEYGFVKIDFLNNHLLSKISSKEEYLELLEKEPDWERLWEDHDFLLSMPQISNHYTTIVQIKPKDIQTMADVIAIIRPGKLKYLDDYINDPIGTREKLYEPEEDSYYYKKSHAVAYAQLIVIAMNLYEKREVPMAAFLPLGSN